MMADKLATLNEINAGVTNALGEVAGLRSRMGYRVTELEQENAVLATEVRMKFSDLTDQIDMLSLENDALRAELLRLQDPSWVTRDAPYADSIPIYLSPSNAKGRIRWRVPLPSS